MENEVAAARLAALRVRTALIAGAPLAMSALFWLALVSSSGLRMGWSDLPERLLFCTALSALGPLSPQFVLGGHSMAVTMPWVALLIWTAYVLLVANTRLGDAHWLLLLVGGLIWCALGTMMGCYAGLQVT